MAQGQANAVFSELMAGLERDPRIDLHRYPVRATFQEGCLVLEGTLENIAAKRVAARIARQVGEHVTLVDRLRVASAARREDGTLRDEVINALTHEPVFTECGLRIERSGNFQILREARGDASGNIDMEVQNGIVKLTGSVGSITHRRLAEVLAWWTAGCELVENRLNVVPPEEENDGELTDAVRMVLEKDPLVHASQLFVTARDASVSLDGYVASQEEKNWRYWTCGACRAFMTWLTASRPEAESRQPHACRTLP